MFPPPPLCGLLQTQRHREAPAEDRSPPVPRAAGRLGHRAVQVRRAQRWYGPGGQTLRRPPPHSSSQLRPASPVLTPSGSRNAPRLQNCGSPHLQHLSLSLAPMHAEPGSSVWPPCTQSLAPLCGPHARVAGPVGSATVRMLSCCVTTCPVKCAG